MSRGREADGVHLVVLTAWRRRRPPHDKPLVKDLHDGIYSLRLTLKNTKLYTISCK